MSTPSSLTRKAATVTVVTVLKNQEDLKKAEKTESKKLGEGWDEWDKPTKWSLESDYDSD